MNSDYQYSIKNLVFRWDTDLYIPLCLFVCHKFCSYFCPLPLLSRQVGKIVPSTSYVCNFQVGHPPLYPTLFVWLYAVTLKADTQVTVSLPPTSHVQCTVFVSAAEAQVIVHPFLEALDRLQKCPIVESSLNGYRHLADQFKCLFKRITWAVFEKTHLIFLPQ